MPFTPLSRSSPESSSTPPQRSAGMSRLSVTEQEKKRSTIHLPPIQGERLSEAETVPNASPRQNPFAPPPRSSSFSAAFPIDFSVKVAGNVRGTSPLPPKLSEPSPLRTRQNPVHSTPKPRSVPLRHTAATQKRPTGTFFTAPAMTPSSRPSRKQRRRAQRTSRKNPLRVVAPVTELIPDSGSRPESRSRARSKPLPLPVLYGIRLLILGVGLGVIAGTLLAALDPSAQKVSGQPNTPALKTTSDKSGNKVIPVVAKAQLPLGNEMTDLTQQLQALASQQADLVPGVFVVDLDTGNYSQLNGDRSFPTASMIKVPVLIAFFQEVDAGRIRLEDKLTMRADLVAPHSGDMQYLPVGTQFTALKVAEEMIRISDNTATNILIDRLGGIAAVSQRFKSWGLQQTVLNQWLPDLDGTNVASPKELVTLMSMLEQGELVSLRSRDRILEILKTPVTNTLLSPGLGPGAIISHKTGDIGTLVGDVGLIDMPSGKRYLAAMEVQRPFNDNRAQELIRQMSRTTYDYLAKLPTNDSKGASPANSLTKPGSSILTQQGEVVSPASVYTAPTPSPD